MFNPEVLLKAGPWGLLVLVIAAIFAAFMSGRLLARGSVQDNYRILEDRAKKAEEREATWQAAAMTWQQTALEAMSNRDEQLEQGRTLIQLLTSLPRGQGRRGG
mgnify:CR=1 FL=1